MEYMSARAKHRARRERKRRIRKVLDALLLAWIAIGLGVIGGVLVLGFLWAIGAKPVP